ncbi:PREDICTED: uncharacterized protein LOC106886733 [Calidris pugnax]|uniref:uncharacterized protein LOC106886733 n=1 Tax=Calidris pugnax TaxID=198806 RepID=UPI00071D73B4|nr:PREDICTED: uncharacterized protein LOC106886733 [Calidris pugnax]
MKLIWRICQVIWMSQHRHHKGPQLKALGLGLGGCGGKREGEPGEEKPKWIHSVSLAGGGEERREEEEKGTCELLFGCLCPLESARRPRGCAGPGGTLRGFCAGNLPIKALTSRRHPALAPTPAADLPDEPFFGAGPCFVPRAIWAPKPPEEVPLAGSHTLARCYSPHVTEVRGKHLFEEIVVTICIGRARRSSRWHQPAPQAGFSADTANPQQTPFYPPVSRKNYDGGALLLISQICGGPRDKSCVGRWVSRHLSN